MSRFFDQLDRAALTIREGALSRAFGWRSTAALHVMLETSWQLLLGAIALTALPWVKFTATDRLVIEAIVAFIAGFLLLHTLKRIAARPVVR